MRIFTSVAMLLLLSACSSESSQRVDYYHPTNQTPNSDWISGEYKPSSNYANRCINPRSDNNYQDLVGTYKDENNWLRSWSHET